MKNLSLENLNNGAAVGSQGEGKEGPIKFPAYSYCKDSGVEWLGVVPEHWGVSPLKWLAEQVTDKATTSNFQVGLENIVGWTGSFIETDTEFAGDGIEFRQKDILFGKLRPYLAKVWLAGKSGQAVGDFFVLRPRAINSDFLHKYILMPTVIENLNASTIGAKMPRVGWEDMAALAVTLPPHKEQIQIARFLDHETARIDALIEEQQRLIELLKEKRQAVISHAVTKGLDPTAPMKDSGVEWLGKMPAHWELKQSKYLLESVTSGSRGWAEYYSDHGDLFFRITNLTRDSIEPKLLSIQYVTPPRNAEGERSKVRVGDILISITADLGSVCVAGQELAGSYVSQHVALARPIQKKVFSRWLAYFVLSDACNDQLVGAGYGGTKVQLSLDDIRSFWVSMPPYKEQVSIANYLDREIQTFDRLIAQAALGMDLLTERRSTLISAAVTGKIDVRGWKPPANGPSHEIAQEAM